MRHVGRAVLILVLLVAVILALKGIFTPATFGEFGPYRSADVEYWMDRPVKFLGSRACQSCHSSNYAQWDDSRHRSVDCESCHGPGYRHVQRPAEVTPDKPGTREFCGRCHNRVYAKPSQYAQVDLAEHGGGDPCIDCHSPHKPTLAGPGGVPEIPHSLQGLSDCRMCHLTERTRPFPEDHEDRTNDTCLHCHDVRQ